MFAFGREGEFRLESGKVWRYSRLTVAILHRFRDWVKDWIGDPFALCERFLNTAPKEVLAQLFKEAGEVQADLRMFGLGTALGQRVLLTEEGHANLWRLLLQPFHPDVTADDALSMLLEAGSDEAARALEQAQGSVPNMNGPAFADLTAGRSLNHPPEAASTGMTSSAD